MGFIRASTKLAEAEQAQQGLKLEHERIRLHLQEAKKAQELSQDEEHRNKVDLQKALELQERYREEVQHVHSETCKIRLKRTEHETHVAIYVVRAEVEQAMTDLQEVEIQVEQATRDLQEAEIRQHAATHKVEQIKKDLDVAKEKNKAFEEILQAMTQRDCLQAQSEKLKEELEILRRAIATASEVPFDRLRACTMFQQLKLDSLVQSNVEMAAKKAYIESMLPERQLEAKSAEAEHDTLLQDKMALQCTIEKSKRDALESQHALEELDKSARKKLGVLRQEIEDINQTECSILEDYRRIQGEYLGPQAIGHPIVRESHVRQVIPTLHSPTQDPAMPSHLDENSAFSFFDRENKQIMFS